MLYGMSNSLTMPGKYSIELSAIYMLCSGTNAVSVSGKCSVYHFICQNKHTHTHGGLYMLGRGTNAVHLTQTHDAAFVT